MISQNDTLNTAAEDWLPNEIFLALTDGHCLYDENLRLLKWSQSFADFYPDFTHKLYQGLEYRDILRHLIESDCIKNLPAKSDIPYLDVWLDEQITWVLQQDSDHGDVKYIHQLVDNRTIQVQQINLSNGHYLFAAREISESVRNRAELRESADKFARFAQLASDWFWELDERLCYSRHSTHKPRISGTSIHRSVKGLSRIEELHNSGIIENDQLLEHDRCLKAHEPVDVVLSTSNKVNQERFAHVKASPIFNSDGTFAGYIGTGRDITEIFNMQQQLSFYSSHDDLTGLINRRSLMDILATSISTVQNTGDLSVDKFVVAQFDLDHFKIINDEAGHLVGDLILKQFSYLVNQRLPAGSHLARLGGDEFVALIPGSLKNRLVLLQDLVGYLSAYHFEFEKSRFRLTASVGLVEPTSTEDSPSSILYRADLACFSAKLLGRNRVEVYSPDNKYQLRQQEEISSLKIAQDAINKENFKLFLQPIVEVRGGDEVAKFEVLLRFMDGQGKIVPPGSVIPVAERYDLMQELDRLILEKSLDWLSAFDRQGCEISLSVNLSGATLGNQQYLNSICEVLYKAVEENGKLNNLCIEITETAAIQNVEVLQNFIRTFHDLGCKFSLDDFGTGLASFKYLRSLTADFLKIDGSFISNILEDEASQAIVKSFNMLAHELGMQTVAEFVENEEIASWLEAYSIDYLQGYYVGVPEDIEVWFDRLSEQRSRIAC